MSEIWLRTGEATVLAAEGQFTDAMPEVLIGDIRGPVGNAFAAMTGQVAGHPRMFVIRDLNQQVRPATMMTTKMTVRSEGLRRNCWAESSRPRPAMPSSTASPRESCRRIRPTRSA